ncbi:hypothetical protein [Sulfitobacter pacificus]|uniref:hypothetical protein n=1 Tax=Sulfitobacter pacificus TaxID=1499314 RepID=UPI0031032580
MAQALSIVGEAGIHGLEYNALIELLQVANTRQSLRGRITPFPAILFTNQEFEDHMILAWRFGYVERSKYREYEYGSGKIGPAYETEGEIIRLTKAGWEFIEAYDDPIIERWLRQIADNIPVILVSVLTTLLATWLIRTIGWG